jgi:hypothetical protein
MIAKLISEYEILLSVHGNECKECLEKTMLYPAFKTFMTKVAEDLVRSNLKNRHIVRVAIQVHAEDNEIESV